MLCTITMMTCSVFSAQAYSADPPSKQYADEIKSLKVKLEAAMKNERRALDEEELANRRMIKEKQREFQEFSRTMQERHPETAPIFEDGSDPAPGAIPAGPAAAAVGGHVAAQTPDLRLLVCDAHLTKLLGGPQIGQESLLGDILGPILADVSAAVRDEVKAAATKAIRDKFKLEEPAKAPKSLADDVQQLQKDVKILQSQVDGTKLKATMKEALIEALDDANVKAKIKKAVE